MPDISYIAAVSKVKKHPTNGRVIAAINEIRILDDESKPAFFKAIVEFFEPLQRNVFIAGLIGYRLLDPQWLLEHSRTAFSFNSGRLEIKQNTLLRTLLEQRQLVLIDLLLKKYSKEELACILKQAFSFLAYEFTHNTYSPEDTQAVAKLMLSIARYLTPTEIKDCGGQLCLSKAVHTHNEELVELLFSVGLNIKIIEGSIEDCVKREDVQGLRLLISKDLISVNQKVRGLTLLDLVLQSINKNPTPTPCVDPMLALLFEFAVDVNAINARGNCALLQVHPKRSDVLQSLLEHGFDVRAEHIDSRLLTLILLNFTEFTAVINQSQNNSFQFAALLTNQSAEYKITYAQQIEQAMPPNLRVRSASPCYL